MTPAGGVRGCRRKLALVVVALALVTVACGGGTDGAADRGLTATFPPDATVPRRTTPPTTGGSATTTPTSTSAPTDEVSRRTADAAAAGLCVEVPASTPIEIPDGSFTPRTPQPGAQMAGAATLGTADFVTVRGDDDLAITRVPPDRPEPVTVVGHFDRTTGTFERRVALERCNVAEAETDGSHLWLLVTPQGSGLREHLLVEVELATGAVTWKRRADSLAWWQPDGDVIRIGAGGSHIGYSYPNGEPPPFGIETIEVGTGQVVASVDVQPMFPMALPSDDGLWIRSQAYETSDVPYEGDPFREVDLETGAKGRSISPVPYPIPAVQDGAVWSLVPGGVERLPLDTLVPEVIGLGFAVEPGASMNVGPSGVWVASVPDRDEPIVVISRIDTATGELRGSFSYRTYTATLDRGGNIGPVRPYLRVDGHGVRVEGLTAPYDGGSDFPSKATYEIVIP